MSSRQDLVVQVVPYYPPHIGGMEVVTKMIAEGLAEHRPVLVLTSTSGAASAPKTERHLNLVVRRLATFEFAHLPILPTLLPQLLRLPRNAVMHVHIAQAYVPEVVWLACRLRRRPYVTHYHLDVEPSGRFGPLFVAYKRWVLGGVLRSAARVIAVSPDQPEFLRRTYRVAAERIVLIPNGVGPEFFREPKTTPDHAGPLRLLFVGRLAPQKDVSLLLRAMVELTHPCELVVVGDGEERMMLERMADELGLTNVRFVGAKTGPELIGWYHWADVFVLTSERESTGLVLLEAMAASLPIVATAVVGVVDTVGDSGLLASPEPAAFAKAVDSVLGDPDLRRDLAGRSYQRAKQFPWSTLLESLQDVYDDAASAAAPRSLPSGPRMPA
jgi:glycosyltransferase involved in cell wall biosynthesis